VTSEWFPGEGRNADDEAFLAELRRLALSAGLADVGPDDTGTAIWEDETGAGWVVAWIRIPGLPRDADPQLQVGFNLNGREMESLVATWETHGFLLDNWDELSGFERDSVGAARRAFEWVSEQLCRPVVRLDWSRRWGPDRSEWLLADTGLMLWSEFASRRPSSVPRVTRLR
jgi:hypothetical protein